MNFVCREEVLAVLEARGASEEMLAAVRRLFMFPAPNPKELDDRNVMGQTEAEFWDLVDR